MKTSFRPLFMALGCWLSLTAFTCGADVLSKAEKLAKDGNQQEAVELLKPLLADKEANDQNLADALTLAINSLAALGDETSAEKTIEDAAALHAEKWRVLAAAGKALSRLSHHGQILDGKFTRSGGGAARRGGYNQNADGTARDRVRTLQLLLAARGKLPADASPSDRAELLFHLFEIWRQSAGEPWKLQALTDLSTLPEPGPFSWNNRELARGYPVDAEGNPVYFQLPASYEAAANDGERLRFALNEWGSVNAANTTAAKALFATLAKQWLGVGTTWALNGRNSEDEGKQRASLFNVHTLTDDETVARLATGPKRIKLPADYVFTARLREVAHGSREFGQAMLPSFGFQWYQATTALIDELTARHQWDNAAAELKLAIAKAGDKYEREPFTKQLGQIIDNLGRFEPGKAQPEGTKAKLALVFRNAATVSLTAKQVDVAKLLEDTKSYLKSQPRDMEWQKTDLNSIGQRLLAKGGGKYLGKTVAEWKLLLEPAEHHWDKRVELETPLDKAGAYWVEAKFQGGAITRALVWIEGLTIVETKHGANWLYFVCDAVTGAPVPDAKVEFFGYFTQWKDNGNFAKRPGYEYQFSESKGSTDAQGMLKVDRSKLTEHQNWRWFATARDAAGRIAFTGFDYFYNASDREEPNAHPAIYVITDRPVYRPGQEVKWKFWARKVGYDPNLDTNAYAGRSCTVTIVNQRSEKLLEKTYKTDDSGAVEDMLKLPDDATLGMYSVTITFNKMEGPQGNHSFRVEEYKKPEFEVKVKAPEKPVALGDGFEFTIKADYYFGGAVKEGKVKYKVSRTAFTDHWFPTNRWDWLFGQGYNWRTISYGWFPGAERWCVCKPRWPWISWQNNPPEVVAEGETAIGADGTVKVKIDSAMTKELHGDEDHRYSLEAEVTDNSRRTILGNGSVIAARHAFETYAWLDRGWYETGGTAEVKISSRTLDGNAVAATGKLRVLKLSYGADGAPNEKEVAAFDLKIKDKEQISQLIKWPAPGQYRLAVALKDEAERESQTSLFTVVRGEKTEEGGYRFDDLELLTEKDEYQPGDEVEVLIHANRPGSTVALFVRATDHPDPLWFHLDGKSASYRFKLKVADQPNIFLEAFTVSNAAIYKAVRQIIVPPSKRIATVELTTSKPTYLPRDKASAKLVVKDQDGKPFVGQVVITAYDKSLEYISGGSNQQDIRPFFWGWKRSFKSPIQNIIRGTEVNLLRSGERYMEELFGRPGYGHTFDTTANSTLTFSGGISVTAGSRRGDMELGGHLMKSGRALLTAPAAAPMAVVPMPADAFAKQAEGRARQEEAPDAPVMIRSNLADSAVWIASAKTNEAGEATIDFAMPDNLTTWKLKSWVMGPSTQVGEAAVEVITRKDLMVRLQAPRFFVEKDEVVISANVHNELNQEQNVEAILETEGTSAQLKAMEGDKPASQRLAIPAHGEHRFDWRLKVSGAGQVKVRAKALAQGDSDAMEMSFTVYEHGTLKTDSWSLGLRPDQPQGTIAFTVPEARKPEMTRLEVRYSPTLAMALVDALPYLSDYPYGCTEQTLSRFVPTVVTLGVLKNLGIDLKAVRDKRVNLNAQEIGDAKKRGQRWQGKDKKGDPKEAVFDAELVNKQAKAGLQRLQAMRNSDGGWGWFPGGRESSAHMTALVVRGLLTAQAAGLKVDDSLLNPALQWLQGHEAEEVRRMKLPEDHRDYKGQPDNTDALIHTALAQKGLNNEAMHAALYKHRGSLSHLNLALLGLACDALKRNDERDMCLRNLRQFLKQDQENQTAWLDLPGNGWWYWYDDPIETQAAFLRLLVTMEPKGDVAPQLAKYLLNNRRNGAYWNSTRDTAAVIEALAAFIKASGESKPEMQLEVLVDGAVKKTLSITAENLFSFDGSLVFEGDEVTTGKHTLEFRKKGSSPLYANAYLTLYSKEDMIPAAGLEIKVERHFFKLAEQKQTTNVSGSRGQVIAQQGVKYVRTAIESGAELKSGDLVEIELSVESKNDYEYILIADPKPAGFEPMEVQSGWTYQGLSAFREFRDEKVAFFAERLPKGRVNLSYRVKAEIPGKFSALPSKAEAMYSPELRANAAEWKARIVDTK